MAKKPTTIMPRDLLLDRFATIETALAETRAAEFKKREAALQANRASAGWAGFAQSADYQALLASRETRLTIELETHATPEVDETLSLVKSVSTPPQTGDSRVFGQISGVDTSAMSVALIKDGGGILASANPNSLGQYVIDTPCVEKQVTLEIHDANGRLLLQDGKPIELREGEAVLRDYSLTRCGELVPEQGDDEQPTLRMPELIGKPVDIATAKIKELGDLGLKISETFDDAQKGLVIAQTPDADTVLSRGDVVTLTASLGPEPSARMPDVVGKPIDAARGALADFSFAALTIDYVDAPNDVGNVVKQEPKPDAPLGADTSILLCIGQAPKTMPDLIGLTESVAHARIVPAFADKIGVAYVDANAQPGIVVAQSPDAGAILAAGIGISVKVSKAVDAPDILVMPELTGLSVETAGARLRELGDFTVETKSVESPQQEGLVIAQHPQAGDTLKPGQVVGLELSAGPAPDLLMPNLIGVSERQAKQTLIPKYAESITINKSESDKKVGTVIKHVPQAGTVIEAGRTITLEIAKPRLQDAPVRMPDLQGLTAARAKKAMSAVGITKLDYDATESRRRGYRVTRQSPEAGDVLKGNETVKLVFGKTS